MQLEEFIASHVKKEVSEDGDCWVAAPLLGLGLQKKHLSQAINSCRVACKDFIKNNNDIQQALNVKKSSISKVAKQAKYSNRGELIDEGHWGETWHMHVLAIILDIDIIGYDLKRKSLTCYSSTGIQIYFPNQIDLSIDALQTRNDFVLLEYNGSDHFNTLKRKDVSIQWKPPVFLSSMFDRKRKRDAYCKIK